MKTFKEITEGQLDDVKKAVRAAAAARAVSAMSVHVGKSQEHKLHAASQEWITKALRTRKREAVAAPKPELTSMGAEMVAMHAQRKTAALKKVTK